MDYCAQDYQSDDNVFLLSMDEIIDHYGTGLMQQTNTGLVGVSPAFNIDFSKIFYTYESGKDKPAKLEDVKNSDETTWTLTLKDGNTDFAASAENTKIQTGDNLKINVSTLGTEPEGVNYTQLSGFIYNADQTEMLAYGKIADAQTGNAAVDLPDSIKNTKGKYVLRVFAEDVNSSASNGLTDYCSNYVDIPFTVISPHEWTYSTDQNVITAKCTDPECDYNKNGLTLTLTAENVEYSGKTYQAVNVEDEISSVTKASVGSVTYYKADSDGKKTGDAISAPTDIGTYIAEVTLTAGEKSVTATSTFEITKAKQTATVSMSDYNYGGTVSTPKISDQKENPEVTYYYTTENKNSGGTKWKDITNETLEPGTYTVYYQVTSRGCNPYHGSAAVTIEKKKAKVTLENMTVCKGTKIMHSKYTATGLVEGEKLTGLAFHIPETTEIGSQSITASDTVDTNYDLTIQGTTITIAEHVWSDWAEKKAATVTTEGTKIRTCSRCGGIQMQTIPATGDSDTGNLNKTVEIEANAPIKEGTLDNTKTELKEDDKLFTQSEKNSIERGKNVNVWLQFSDTDMTKISSADQTNVENVAKKELGENAQLQYFDVDMFKQIDGETKKQVTQTNTPIQITIVIPDNLINHKASMVRNYEIIRLHNSEVSTITGNFNSTTNEFSFATNKFSTYAIAYADKPKNSGSGSSSSGNTTPAKPTVKITTATSEGGKITASKTGDITKGDTITYTVTPADGYEIKDVLVDGKSVGAVTSYTFTNVTEKHTISAVFVKKNAQKPDDNKSDVTDQSKLNGNQVSKLKLPILLAKGKGGKQQITLSWLKVKDADGYEAYWSYCDGGKNYKKFATVKNGKLTVTQKKLKNSEKYKYFVVAYKMVDGKKVYIAKSNHLHVAMLDNKQTNAKSVSVNKTDVVLTKKQTFTIQAKIRLENGKKKPLLHTAEFRYYTTDARVAKVNSDGVITAKGAGSCTIYVLANNGV